MQDFKKLTVWEKAHALTLKIYAATESFPISGDDVKQHLRQASTLIASRIAVGSAKYKPTEFVDLLKAAESAAVETEYLLMLSCDLQYLSAATYKTLDKELHGVKKMLAALTQKIEANL